MIASSNIYCLSRRIPMTLDTESTDCRIQSKLSVSTRMPTVYRRSLGPCSKENIWPSCTMLGFHRASFAGSASGENQQTRCVLMCFRVCFHLITPKLCIYQTSVMSPVQEINLSQIVSVFACLVAATSSDGSKFQVKSSEHSH